MFSDFCQVIMESSNSFRTTTFSAPAKNTPPVYSEMECDQSGLFQVNMKKQHIQLWNRLPCVCQSVINSLLPSVSACGVSSGGQSQQIALESLYFTQQPAGDKHQRRGATQRPGGGGGDTDSRAPSPSHHHLPQTHSGWSVCPFPPV